jgi:hypothetical protein
MTAVAGAHDAFPPPAPAAVRATAVAQHQSNGGRSALVLVPSAHLVARRPGCRSPDDAGVLLARSATLMLPFRRGRFVVQEERCCNQAERLSRASSEPRGSAGVTESNRHGLSHARRCRDRAARSWSAREANLLRAGSVVSQSKAPAIGAGLRTFSRSGRALAGAHAPGGR